MLKCLKFIEKVFCPFSNNPKYMPSCKICRQGVKHEANSKSRKISDFPEYQESWILKCVHCQLSTPPPLPNHDPLHEFTVVALLTTVLLSPPVKHDEILSDFSRISEHLILRIGMSHHTYQSSPLSHLLSQSCLPPSLFLSSLTSQL